MNTQLRSLTLASACALALAGGTANAAVTTVYKCFDRNLGVLYTDMPCRGEQLSIEGGNTDPVAIQELRREREAVARQASERVAELRRVDVAPQYVYGGGPAMPMQDNSYAGDAYYPLGYGYAPGYGDGRGDGRGRGDQGFGRHNRYQPRPSLPAPRGNLIKR